MNLADLNKVKFLRMERKSTDSWITFVLPRMMPFIQAANWAEARMPGWETVCGCPTDPDNE